MIGLLAVVLAFCTGYLLGVVSWRRSARRGRLVQYVLPGKESPLIAESDDGTIRMEIVGHESLPR